MKKNILLSFAFAFFCLQNISAEDNPEQKKKFEIASPAFQNGETVPQRYTCSGANINPPFSIENIPVKTKSLALIVDDPQAQEGVWVHWVVYNIPSETNVIKEKSNPGIQGLNDFGRFKYQGPCPTDEKTHKYSFRVYALDTELYLLEGIIKADVEAGMRGHILDQAEMVGTLRQKSIVGLDED